MARRKKKTPISEVERITRELGELEDIFTQVRAATWTNTPLPDFSGIKQDEDILVLLSVLWSVCRERIVRIIDQPDIEWRVIYQRADALRYTISEPRNVAALFHHELLLNGLESALRLLSLLCNLIKLDLLCAYTYGEILNRINTRYLGKKVFTLIADEARADEDAFLEMLNFLRLGPRKRKIKDLSSEDLQQEARLGAWCYWQNVKTAVSNEIKLPQSPVRLPSNRAAMWRTVNPILLQAEAKALAGPLLPILRGEWERFSNKAYQPLKNLLEKQTAKKRDGIKLELELDKQGAWGDQGSFLHPAISERIVLEWREGVASGYEEMDLKLLTRAVLRYAEKNLPPRAAIAFKARLTVDTDKEAAQLAGITERTFRTYCGKVREALADKN